MPQIAGLNYFSLILLVSITHYSCNTTEPPIIIPPPPVVKDTLTVSVESFTHRSVTLNVQSTVNSLQSTIRVFRSFNNIQTVIAEYPILVKDTTITDDDNGAGLLLDTTYTYYAVRVDSLGQLKDTSNIVTQKTLAPTSHNYTWQEFTIGEWQSALYDVWGTDENNVWACGGVTINDTVHGLLHWDGVQWTPKGRGGGYAMYGFAADDIWTVGGSIFHYDGQNWNEVLDIDPVLQANIPYTSIWGTSSSNLYLGNQWGKIIHWDGNKATVIQSFDGTYITDISGLPDIGFYVVGSKNTSSGNNLVAFYNFSTFQNINNSSLLNTFPQSVKMFSNDFVLIGGNNLFLKTGANWESVPINNYGTVNKIRGDKTNNIFAVGFFKEAYHFNGLDWYFYNELNNQQGEFKGVFVVNDVVFIVGQEQNAISAIIIIGRK